LKTIFKVAKLKLKFVEIVIWYEVLNVVGLTFSVFKAMLKSCCLKNGLLILIVISRAYASFAVMLKVVDDNNVANSMLGVVVDTKVAKLFLMMN
jgi:hypothetical protein